MDTLHTALTRQLDDSHPIAAQNRQAAESTLTTGDLYLEALNRNMEATLRLAACQSEMRDIVETVPARTSFSTGNGACQVREW